jgi:hypothetical protein
MANALKIVFSQSRLGWRSHSESGDVRESWKPSVVFQNYFKPCAGRNAKISPPQTTR